MYIIYIHIICFDIFHRTNLPGVFVHPQTGPGPTEAAGFQSFFFSEITRFFFKQSC